MWKDQKVVGEQLGTVVPEQGDVGPKMGLEAGGTFLPWLLHRYSIEGDRSWELA
jgi:hypothetical protein